MTHELDVLRTTRASVDRPSAETRDAVRARWDTDTLTAVTVRASDGRKNGVKVFTARTLIAAGLAVALTAGVWMVTRERISSVKPNHTVDVSSLAEAAAHEPQVFLLVGSDSRSFVSTDRDAEQFGDPATNSGTRSDAMVLVRVEPDSRRVVTMSIPRDLFVDVPGCGTRKINGTFDDQFDCGGRHGGTQLLVDTITKSLGVPVNHVIEVHFPQFAALVDQLGGLRINFPLPTRDKLTGLEVPAGCATLSGDQALAFVRSRYFEVAANGQWQSDPRSDLGRTARQQLALRQLAAAAEARAGADPRPLLRALFDHVTVDSGFTADDALRYFRALREDRVTVTSTLPVTMSMQGDQSGLVLAPGAQGMLDILAGRSHETNGDIDVTTTPGFVGTPTAC
jgi:LCP family protein required for cell wall assembly